MTEIDIANEGHCKAENDLCFHVGCERPSVVSIRYQEPDGLTYKNQFCEIHAVHYEYDRPYIVRSIIDRNYARKET